ncbi:MAG: aromatic-ring-hydroxylating dioxygenase subunit beta [Halieaceae bacterium]|nr:aromatic-ring-hydroxylating dioxygenase subunit beta [Halieaceae bacterium]
MSQATQIDSALQHAIEAFIYREASLLDTWQLEEWQSLFTDDGEYLVPPLNAENPETIDTTEKLFLIVDNRETLNARAERMMRKDAYAESPRSRIRHMVSNVSILSENGTEIRVTNNLVVYRFRRGELSTYVGTVHYDLVRTDGLFKIRRKRVCLDNDSLKPQGSLAIIL